eukprot:TRINITY_DN9779_c0_g1_i2.p1 TRINITY_DN9779_c0_g1~~TRINITY_DN9779_c0_g1_i2.p1  ORF type:complete len:222 (+),score=13.90 TRINITY_DN9779_c0_g1_i2:49-666(+)
MDKDAIIFDLGGVVINLSYDATTNAFEKLGMGSVKDEYSQASQSTLYDNVETGKISPEQFIMEMMKKFPPSIQSSEVTDAWNAMILDLPEGRVEFLLELKAKYKIFLLSNTNALHIEKVLENWSKTSKIPPHEVFDKIYYSHEVGMRKPNVCVFEHVLREQNLDASKTLFIDDSFQHIVGARKAGIEAIHLQPGETIEALLRGSI